MPAVASVPAVARIPVADVPLVHDVFTVAGLTDFAGVPNGVRFSAVDFLPAVAGILLLLASLCYL